MLTFKPNSRYLFICYLYYVYVYISIMVCLRLHDTLGYMLVSYTNGQGLKENTVQFIVLSNAGRI